MRITNLSQLTLLILMMAMVPLQAQKSKKKKKKKKDVLVTISTEFGDINLLLFDETPIHKENFIKLSEEGFFNGSAFHRVMKNFMIQGGDPNTKAGGDRTKIGTGGPGYTLEAEILPQYKHDKGMLAAARQSDQVNPERRSSGSQFYIVQNEDGAHHLDGAYTIFGRVISGLDVVDKIAAQPVGRGGLPQKDIAIQVETQKIKVKKLLKMFPKAYEG